MSESSPKKLDKSSTEVQPLGSLHSFTEHSSNQPMATQSTVAQFPFTSRDLLREDEMHEVLQLSSSQVSQATASNAATLVQLSNSDKSHERLQQLLPLYFYSWNLTDLHSVVVFLLLHYFLLRKEHKETLGAKGLYEEHIALLKSRMSDLEEKLSNSQSSQQSGSGSRNSNGDLRKLANDDQLVTEVERLRGQVESLQCENIQLRRSNDEVCRINEQWALDYQSLSDQVKNATGCYSVQSGSSSSHSSARASPVPAGMYAPPCLQCAQMELQLEAKRDEIRALGRKMDDIKADLKKSEALLERKDRNVERLNSENHAILLQLQEIGDLQAAVKMKHDYRKLQFQLSQTNKQYQEAVSEKLQYQKQVEKLRHAFLSVFPFPNAPPQSVIQTTSCGYSSFPAMRTCRRQHHNQYPHSDPAPPTPPGLIARGDHRGSLVEKDISVELQDQSLRPVQSHDGHMTSMPHDKVTNGSHDSHMTNKHHQLVVPDNGHPSYFTPTPPSTHLSTSSMYESSRPHLTTSDYSSSKSLPQYSIQLAPTSSASASRQTSSTGFSSSHTALSGLSGSDGVSVTPPMVTAPTSLVTYPYHSRSTPGKLSSMPRPSSLSVGVQRSNTSSQHLPQKVPNQQKFECPSCRKQFMYGPQEFNQWFEHIRYCEYKP